MAEEITVKVYRYEPGSDEGPEYKTYHVPYEEGITVLEALMHINDNIGPISFRYECRFQSCGACGVMVNDKPVLACKQAAEAEIQVDPLPVFPVIKDLVVDHGSYYKKRAQLRPYIERTRLPAEFPEPISYETDLRYREYVDCIDCFLCQVACPVLKEKGTRFIGPALMTYIARFALDPRDELDRVRMALSEGLMECTLCGECEKVCPKGRRIMEVDIKRLRELAKLEGLI